MSHTLNVVLQRLRDFSNNKLAELDGLCNEHQRWLQSEVEHVKQQAAAQAPAAKRQKVQLAPAPARVRGRKAKAAAPALEPVAEEEEGEESAPAHEAEPAPEPASAPAARTRRSRKQPEQTAVAGGPAGAPAAEDVEPQAASKRARSARGRGKGTAIEEAAIAAVGQADTSPARPSGDPVPPAEQPATRARRARAATGKAAVKAAPPVTAVPDEAAAEPEAQAHVEQGLAEVRQAEEQTEPQPGPAPAGGRSTRQRNTMKRKSAEPGETAAATAAKPATAARPRGRGRTRKEPTPPPAAEATVDAAPTGTDMAIPAADRAAGILTNTFTSDSGLEQPADKGEQVQSELTALQVAAAVAVVAAAPDGQDAEPEPKVENPQGSGAAPQSPQQEEEQEQQPSTMGGPAAEPGAGGGAAGGIAQVASPVAQGLHPGPPLEPMPLEIAVAEALAEDPVAAQRGESSPHVAAAPVARVLDESIWPTQPAHPAQHVPQTELEHIEGIAAEPVTEHVAAAAATAQQAASPAAVQPEDCGGAPVGGRADRGSSPAPEEADEMPAGEPVPAPKAAGSMASNLVSTLRSFLPMVKQPDPALPANGKKSVKVRALEAAEAARKREEERAAERAKQRLESEKQRQERVKAKQEEEQRRQEEELKRKEELRLRKEQEAAQRRKEREEAEKREKEEKTRRLEELKKRREEAAAPPLAVPAQAAGNKLPVLTSKPAAVALAGQPDDPAKHQLDGGAVAADGGASQAGARKGLHYLQREAEPAPPATVPTNAPAPPAATAVPSLELKPLALPVLRPVQPPQQIQSQQAAAGLIKEPAAKATAQGLLAPLKYGAPSASGSTAVVPGPAAQTAAAGPSRLANSSQQQQQQQQQSQPQQAPQGPQNYEISPYKSDFESDDDQPKKPVPEWARGRQLLKQLTDQMYVDPDEIFQQHQKTCTLDEVFAQRDKTGKQDYNRRTSSGNWIDDRVTWKEELNYKKAMGYMS